MHFLRSKMLVGGEKVLALLADRCQLSAVAPGPRRSTPKGTPVPRCPDRALTQSHELFAAFVVPRFGYESKKLTSPVARPSPGADS